MKAYQVFGRMNPEQTTALMDELAAEAPGIYTQAVAAAAAVMKARPKFMMSLPAEKRGQMVRRSLARVAASPLAEEVLASYFLGPKKDLLIEWLDALGIAHEEGSLEEGDPECPPEDKLRDIVEAFRKEEDREVRELLLQAFASQSAIDWPPLEALIGAEE